MVEVLLITVRRLDHISLSDGGGFQFDLFVFPRPWAAPSWSRWAGELSWTRFLGTRARKAVVDTISSKKCDFQVRKFVLHLLLLLPLYLSESTGSILFSASIT